MTRENFVTTDWLAARLGEPDARDRRRVLAPAADRTRRLGGVSPRPHPRRGVLRHRRDRRHVDRLAAHAARRDEVRRRDDDAGPGRRHALRRLRFSRPVRRGAGVVDLARLRRRGGRDSRRRPAAMAARGPPDRTRRRASAPAYLHPAPQPRLRRLARRRAADAGERLGPGRRRAAGRPLRRPRARAAAGRAQRPHPRQPQPAVRRDRRARPAEARPGAQRPSPPAGSISPSRSSRPAARASPPPSSPWRSRRRAARSPDSTTAPGPNGARAPIVRSRPARRRRPDATPAAAIAETATEIKRFLSSVLRTTGYQWHGG